MSDEGDRWFAIEQDRKREQMKRDARLKKLQRDYARESRHRSAVPVKMRVSKWTKDENGILSRTVIGE